MTNFEKYKDDLMKTKGDFGFSKTKQKIGVCGWVNNNIETVKCEDCLFDEPSTCCCDSEKIKWLYKEADEPVLTNNELELIKALNKATGKEWKFIGRNKIGEVILFTDEPLIQNNAFGIYFKKEKGYCLYMNGNYLFSNIAYDAGGCGLYDIENKVYHKYK
jgi:hypothetical protein